MEIFMVTVENIMVTVEKLSLLLLPFVKRLPVSKFSAVGLAEIRGQEFHLHI